ncbi:MAG: MFS transporter [Coriobacteriia bacterium]
MTTNAASWRPTRASVTSWVLYDLANTTFALGVGSRYFGPWVIEANHGSDWWIGATTAVAMLIVIVTGPWIGALTDHIGTRRPYLIGATLTCVAATALLATGGIWPSLVLYAIGTVGFNVGAVVYDAMLPDVSTEENRGRISGIGVATGYAGSAIALGLGAYLLPRFGYAWVFRSLAVAFLVFAFPAFIWVRERPRVRRPGRPPGILQSPRLVVEAWREAAKYPGVVRFLIGRFLYTDAINTVFLFNAIFAKFELGFTDGETNALALVGIVAAGLGALLAGRLVDSLGPRKVLHVAVYALLLAVTSAICAKVLDVHQLGWLVGVAGGGGLGAVWAADRVYMTRLSPPDKIGEFFGLYAAVGRFATVLGPIAWALVADGLGLGRTAALGALAIFIIAARIVLQGVREPVQA